MTRKENGMTVRWMIYVSGLCVRLAECCHAMPVVGPWGEA